MTKTKNYIQEAIRDAKEMCRNFMDEIMEKLQEDKEVSDDLYNDYPDGDSYHHENHVDHAYELLEAAQILDWCSTHKETDWGLWQGLEPEEAISAQAAYTYGNCVMFYWQQIIQEINEDVSGGILADMLGQDDPASPEIVKARVEQIIEDYN